MTPYWKHVFGDSIENLITKNIYQETIDVCIDRIGRREREGERGREREGGRE